MNLLEMLRLLIIGPIELLLDVVFAISMKITDSPGFSIAALSLTVSLLVLPLYNRADEIQQKERDLTLKMSDRIKRIKAAFSGDERFMMLQTYYRQNHYKPYYALRGSISLLLQIPFFMAAYRFLSGLRAIQGVSWGPIQDLGQPDRMLTIFGIAVNVLPVLMTGINILSGVIYTRGMPFKTKIQLYGMALIFLVLLYDSPAGLTLYWTLNNLFSLGKNILKRFRNPGRVVSVICSAGGIVFGVAFFLRAQAEGARKLAWVILLAFVMQLPLIIQLFTGRRPAERKQTTAQSKGSFGLFLVCCFLLTILTGVLIPSSVVRSSPAEFVEVGHYQSPLKYILHSLLLGAGFFLIWLGILYWLSPEEKRKLFGPVITSVTVMALANYMLFGQHYGNMSSMLKYDVDISGKISTGVILLNLGVAAVLGLCVFLLWKKNRSLLKALCFAGCVAVGGMSIANIAAVNGRLPEIKKIADRDTAQEPVSFPLDRSGKNVIVLMLDRGIGEFVPWLFQEKPELQEQFRGFIYYPNTLSYGHNTNTGSPPLFGGYEYVPEIMNQRSDELLKDKQNEALKVMPVLFLRNGFEVTVCDPPLANYEWIPDLSIYSDYPEIRTFNTLGHMSEERNLSFRVESRNRNMFCYSLFRIAPVLLHAELYDDGNYNHTDSTLNIEQYVFFMESYQVLQKLPEIAEIKDDGKNTFLMMTNDTTHDTIMLKEPEYEPSQERIDNSEYDALHLNRISTEGKTLTLSDPVHLEHYQCNMAALLQIGKWLDYLREEGVYDNTRIVIVADHGRDLNLSGRRIESLGIDITSYNPLMLVKDFGCNDPWRISHEFMTNADTPVLAFSELIEQPVNPFSGQVIGDMWKTRKEQWVCSTPWNLEINHGYQFADSQYYSLQGGDVLNPLNWSKVP